MIKNENGSILLQGSYETLWTELVDIMCALFRMASIADEDFASACLSATVATVIDANSDKNRRLAENPKVLASFLRKTFFKNAYDMFSDLESQEGDSGYEEVKS